MVRHFPQWDIDSSPVVATRDTTLGIQMRSWSKVQSAGSGDHLVVVCSHDCDLENPRQRTGVLLAPLVKVPASVNSELYDEIMGSGDLSKPELTWINLFPLTIETEDASTLDVVVDFSAAISMGRAQRAVSVLLDTKQCEMDDELRKTFKRKLGAFFARA